MWRVFLTILKKFDTSIKNISVYEKALNVIRCENELSVIEHLTETILLARIESPMGNFTEVLKNAKSVKEHLINTPNTPIPKVFLLKTAKSSVYTMHEWVMIDGSYATISEILALVDIWLFLSQETQNLKSNIKNYNVYSATPEEHKYRILKNYVDSLERIVLSIINYLECYVS